MRCAAAAVVLYTFFSPQQVDSARQCSKFCIGAFVLLGFRVCEAQIREIPIENRHGVNASEKKNNCVLGSEPISYSRKVSNDFLKYNILLHIIQYSLSPTRILSKVMLTTN